MTDSTHNINVDNINNNNNISINNNNNNFSNFNLNNNNTSLNSLQLPPNFQEQIEMDMLNSINLNVQPGLAMFDNSLSNDSLHMNEEEERAAATTSQIEDGEEEFEVEENEELKQILEREMPGYASSQYYAGLGEDEDQEEEEQEDDFNDDYDDE